MKVAKCSHSTKYVENERTTLTVKPCWMLKDEVKGKIGKIILKIQLTQAAW